MRNEPSYIIVGTVAWRRIYYIIFSWISYTNWRLTRYAKMRVVHVPGCKERFPRQWIQRKPLVSDPDTQHGTCITHMPWCTSGSLTRGGGENVTGITGACTTRNFYVSGKRPMLSEIQRNSSKRICFSQIANLIQNTAFENIVSEVSSASSRPKIR